MRPEEEVFPMIRLLASQHPPVRSVSPHTRVQYRWVAARLDQLVCLRVAPFGFALGGCGLAAIVWTLGFAIHSLSPSRAAWLAALLALLVTALTTLVSAHARSRRAEAEALLSARFRVDPELAVIAENVLDTLPITAWLIRPRRLTR